jgi:tripartite-type tricarboxylate transporter receptor subunit TctC
MTFGKEKFMKGWGVLALGFFLMLVLFHSGISEGAENYPLKLITCIIPNEAGGDADTLARPLMQMISHKLGKPIMIVNKPGAGSSLGYREILASKADGYTIGTATGSIVTNKIQGIMRNDFQDFTLIGTYATYIPFLIASTKTQHPYTSIEEVISVAKAKPEEISLACGGVGLQWWIATMGMQQASGLRFNIIPQAGGGGFSVTQVAGGHTDLAVVALGAASSQLAAGNVRLLAFFGPTRAGGKYGSIPTLKEVGINFTYQSTQVVLGPPKMPTGIVEKLAKTLEETATSPEYVQNVMDHYATPFHLSPQKTFEFLTEQRVVYTEIMKRAGIVK